MDKIRHHSDGCDCTLCVEFFTMVDDKDAEITTLKAQLAEAKDMQSMDEQSLAEARKLLALWRKFGKAYKMNTPPGKEYQELFEAGELDTSEADAYQGWCSVHGREG